MGAQHILRAAALRHGASASGPWPESLPESSATLEGWWDFSTLPEGVPVSSHPNSASTAAWPLAQATSGNRPVGKANIQNGLSVARFDGIDDYLDALAASARLTGNQISIVIVAIRRAVTTGAALLSLGTDTSSTEFTTAGGALIGFEGGGGDRHVNYRNGGGLALIGTHPGDNVAFRLTTFWDGTNNVMERGGATNSAADATPAIAAKLLRIGDRTPNSNPGQFDYCEILAYNGALSTADRAYVGGHLDTKWAL